MHNIIFLIFILFFFIPNEGMTQVITTLPIFPQETDSVIVTFDATQGSGGLAGFNGDVYAHTGVITNLSASSGDWKYVKTNWGQNTPETKLTKIGPDLYAFRITPDIRSFYNVPMGEKILKIALVFRSANKVSGGYLEGKTADGGDIFADVYDVGLNMKLNKPQSGYALVNMGDTLPIEIVSINADSVFLFHNNNILDSDSGNFLQDTIIANSYGKFWIKGVAADTVTQVKDSFYYYVQTPPDTLSLPGGIIEGINYIDSQKVVLCLYAPDIDYVFALGDFNNWQLDPNYLMHITPDMNHFWIEIDNLIVGKEYIFQYLINGKIAVGDPYAEKVSDPWNDSWISPQTYPNMLAYPDGKTKGIATVFQTNRKDYSWQNKTYNIPSEEDLVVYELLIRDFTAAHTFQSVIDSLHYLKTLGINAIELMPISEFEGNNSWGYNPNYYFAVDKYYGPKEDFKRLIDTCHSMGLAVIMDVVYNHSFGTSPYVMMWWDEINNRPAFNNPFFNPIPKHDFNVGFDMNHESMATKRYISRALKFWTENYKIDGFRFDLSKGFTQTNTLGNSSAMAHYDASRIHILESYADTIWSVNPKAYVILEHFADNDEEKVLSSKGMMLWGNLNGNYSEAAMGYNNAGKSDFGWIVYQQRTWNEPHVMGYMESHDEERNMYKCSQWGKSSGDYNIKTKSTYMERASLNAAFFLTIPGPKMIWQFGELGYDVSIDFNGRTGEKPIKWEYTKDIDRWNNYQIYSALTNLRAEEKACFQTTDFDWDFGGAVKSLLLRDTSMNAVVIGNFGVESTETSIDFPHDGTYFDYLSGQEIEVKNKVFVFDLEAGEFHILLDKKKSPPEQSIAPKSIKEPIDFQGNLEIYPNPSGGNVSIFINTPIASTLLFYDAVGRFVGSTEIASSGKQIISLNTLNIRFHSGLYFCKLVSGETIEIKKFILL